MNVEEVKARVQAIRANSGDDEAAHSDEDNLHQEVLQAIADGTCDDPRACAGAALETTKIDFSRWCA